MLQMLIGTQHRYGVPPTRVLHLAGVFFKLIGGLAFAFDAAAAQPIEAVPSYKELIHRAVQSSFVNPGTVSAMEISALHPTRLPQLGDWMACIRISIAGESAPALYAAFFQGDPVGVSLLRRAVQFDHCRDDQYEPFSAREPAEVRPQNVPRKKQR